MIEVGRRGTGRCYFGVMFFLRFFEGFVGRGLGWGIRRDEGFSG